MNAPAICVSGLEKAYGAVPVLKGVDFEVVRGSIFALLGSNGAGKTTLVRILATLLKADSGTASVSGYDVARRAARVRESISLTGQFAAVDEMLTGRENLFLVAKLRHVKHPGRVADELLGRVRARRGATAGAHGRTRLEGVDAHRAAQGGRTLADPSSPPGSGSPACRELCLVCETLAMQFDDLVSRIERLTAQTPRVLIGIAGSPGSGKTTLATALVARLGDAAVHLPMDGFHLANATLERLVERHIRGGRTPADAERFAREVDGSNATLIEPTADRAALRVPGF